LGPSDNVDTGPVRDQCAEFIGLERERFASACVLNYIPSIAEKRNQGIESMLLFILDIRGNFHQKRRLKSGQSLGSAHQDRNFMTIHVNFDEIEASEAFTLGELVQGIDASVGGG
jgi:hypothetical protein